MGSNDLRSNHPGLRDGSVSKYRQSKFVNFSEEKATGAKPENILEAHQIGLIEFWEPFEGSGLPTSGGVDRQCEAASRSANLR